jgi:hypothetical protein
LGVGIIFNHIDTRCYWLMQPGKALIAHVTA